MKRILVLSLAMAGSFTAAMAQNPEVLQQQAPNMPPLQKMPLERVEPKEPAETGSTGGNLSDKLQQSDGVIRPPQTATPDIRVPAPVPEPGTTPVIPPPGSPGGDPQIQPK
ncbi:hypothetical protein AB4Y85_03325 [Microvirga sp. 2YAF29]|uniref:hypothetical protein n=1 Tax=Microvirga sp. 2YAF29 TaxID=3233031 RepID=UPI003F9CF05B